MKPSVARAAALRWLLAAMLPLLAACAAPSPQTVESPAATGSDQGAIAQADARPQAGRKRQLPPVSDPYPPRKADRGAPVRVDRSCRTDSDCVVKDVGNCCGAFPACVNKASPTDPVGVRAQCAKDGIASVCGFTEIEGCRCANGTCIAGVAPLDPSQDPPVPVR